MNRELQRLYHYRDSRPAVLFSYRRLIRPGIRQQPYCGLTPFDQICSALNVLAQRKLPFQMKKSAPYSPPAEPGQARTDGRYAGSRFLMQV